MPGELRHLTIWEDHHIVGEVAARDSWTRRFKFLKLNPADNINSTITTTTPSVGCVVFRIQTSVEVLYSRVY